jgi:hypothetical protein
LRRTRFMGRSGRRIAPALRGVAVVAALGLLLAEWASLHHMAAASACADAGESVHLGEAVAAADDDGAWDRDASHEPRLYAFDALAAGDLSHDLCHLCRSSRERFASAATTVAYANDSTELGSARPAQLADAVLGAAIYTVAPKTSPPA